MSPEEKAALIASTKSPISLLSKLGQSIAISRKRNPKVCEELICIPFVLCASLTHMHHLYTGIVKMCNPLIVSSTGQKREGSGWFGEEKENQPVRGGASS